LDGLMPEADPFYSHMAPGKSGLPKGNVRKLTGGRQGGQPGHEGKTPVQTDSPDKRTCLLKERGKCADNPGWLIGRRKRRAFGAETFSAVTGHVHETYLSGFPDRLGDCRGNRFCVIPKMRKLMNLTPLD
jgi:hypothetical protein